MVVLTASAATTWNLEPLQLAPTLVASLLYLRRTRTLARRGLPVPGWRQFLFWLGIGLVVIALNSPVDEIGEKDFFFVHMLQHVLIGDLAPLCFVLGLDGRILRPEATSVTARAFIAPQINARTAKPGSSCVTEPSSA